MTHKKEHATGFVRKKVPKEWSQIPKYTQGLKAMQLTIQCFMEVSKQVVNKPAQSTGGQVARSVLYPYSNAAPVS